LSRIFSSEYPDSKAEIDESVQFLDYAIKTVDPNHILIQMKKLVAKGMIQKGKVSTQIINRFWEKNFDTSNDSIFKFTPLQIDGETKPTD